VHEMARLGMLEVFDGARKATPAYLRFRISMDCIGVGRALARDDFDSEIRSQHSFASFQHPDKIAEAVRLISEAQLWNCVGAKLGADGKEIKERLQLIVNRRNKIAHEADLDPTYPKARWPISAPNVDNVVIFLVELVEAIHEVVAPTLP